MHGPPDTELIDPAILDDPYTQFLLELMHGDLAPESNHLGSTDFDLDSWSLTVEEGFAMAARSESSIVLMKDMDQLQKPHSNNNAPNTSFATAAPAISPSSRVPSPEAQPANFHATPMPIRSEHQTYLCSWYPHQNSSTQCDHVAPDRAKFLRHLGRVHQVAGGPNATIICQLLNSQTGSVCKSPIKRGNFPRHVDTHYPLRYNCQLCPPGISFSRQDTWKKHVKSKHPDGP